GDEGDGVKGAQTKIDVGATGGQSRAVASADGGGDARHRAHGSASAHGRNARSVMTRNSLEPSDASSSGKTRGPAPLRTRLSTSVYRRKPRLSASTSTYHGRAVATRRSTPHHGTHSVRGR